MKRSLFLLPSIIYFFFFFLCLVIAFANVNPFNNMRDETVSFFKPMNGNIISVDGRKAVVDLGGKNLIKAGMRLNIFREEATFKHPVTKETLGKMESMIGKLEVKKVELDSSEGVIIQGDAKEGDKIRISEMKVNLLFCQSDDIDWYLADSYHRLLKETGRFNMIDTDLDTDDALKVIEEARSLGAEIALSLTTETTDSGTILIQRLFWVSDGFKFSELHTKTGDVFTNELKIGDKYFSPHKEEAWLEIDLSINAKLITTGDIDGDGKQEIILSTGNTVEVFAFGVTLQPAIEGTHIKSSTRDEHIWIDAIDLNRNGKDEIIITSKKENDIISYVYELIGSDFVLLYKKDMFLRKIENTLIAQNFSPYEGFDGEIFSIIYDNGIYQESGALNLPKGVNIYDFIYIDDSILGRLALAYDEKGFLNVYDDKGTRIWRSETDTGGFLSTFEKTSPSIFIDRGEWSVKDKLFKRNRDVLYVKRIHYLEIIKSFGHRRSQIKSLLWDGLSMEEGVLIDDIKGSVLDYTMFNEKILILRSPRMGFKAGNLLKGENPLGTLLEIYTIKGS